VNSVEDQILDFTAHHLGVKKQKVSLSSCLSRDLGMAPVGTASRMVTMSTPEGVGRQSVREVRAIRHSGSLAHFRNILRNNCAEKCQFLLLLIRETA
jgi:hypothetical protein